MKAKAKPAAKKKLPAKKQTSAKKPRPKKTTPRLTEIVFILDRSGSMSGREADTIGGFNSLVGRQRRLPGEVLVSTVLFDDQMEVLHNRVPLGRIGPMTSEQYFTRGSTALLDAIGRGIDHIGRIHKHAAAADVPDKTLFVITTDGMENASHAYSHETIRAMIERQRSTWGWEFLFLGANIDAPAAAQTIGIDPNQAVNFLCDAQGVGAAYQGVSEAIHELRTAGSVNTRWRKRLDADFGARSKK